MRLLKLLLLSLLIVAPCQAQTVDGPLLAMLECPDRVKDVAFSPDGKLLAAGFGWNSQGGVRVWNVSDRKVLATLSTGNNDGANVECIAFSPDGKLLAAANWNGDVLVWTTGSWKSPRTILKHESPKSLSFSPDNTKLALTAEDAVIIYDFNSNKAKTLTTSTDERGSFVSASFAPSGNSLFVFCDRAVETWDVASTKLTRTWKPAGGSFFGNISSDGNYVIAGGGAVFGKKSVGIWTTANQQKIAELTAFRNGLFGFTFAHSAKLFALAGGDYGSGGDLSLWALDDPHEIGFVSFGEFPFDAVSFSPDDKVLAAASNDAFVLLYAVDRIRGPHVKKQDYALCGEIVKQDEKTFIVPLSKVPVPMRPELEYAWKLELVNSNAVAELNSLPIVFSDWSIESRADADRASISQFRLLLQQPKKNLDHILFGVVQNPGWDEGFVTKIYEDGSFVAANNVGRCLAYGRLDQLKTDFDSIKSRLVNAGLLAVPRDPLTIGADHYRTQFMGLRINGADELRSDADSAQILLSGKTFGQARGVQSHFQARGSVY